MFTDTAFTTSFQPANSHSRAASVFEQEYMQGLWDRFWAALTRHAHSLRRLPASLSEGRYAGAQVVPIDQILGTEDRGDDFDADFHPLHLESRDRWMSVYTAWLKGASLPPVELTHVGDAYYVRDGHHRVSVARSLGRDFIDAIVIERSLNLPR